MNITVGNRVRILRDLHRASTGPRRKGHWALYASEGEEGEVVEVFRSDPLNYFAKVQMDLDGRVLTMRLQSLEKIKPVRARLHRRAVRPRAFTGGARCSR